MSRRFFPGLINGMAKLPKRQRNRKVPPEIQALKPDHKIFALVRRSVNPRWDDCFPKPDPENPLTEPVKLPKFTKSSVRKLCETMLDTKLPMEFAAMAMGYTVKEFDEWMKQGELDMENSVRSPEAYLAYNVNRTKAKVVTMILREMDTAGAGTWQKYAWEMERTFALFKNHPPAGKVKTPEKGVLDALADQWLNQALNPGGAEPLELPKIKQSPEGEKQ